MADATEAINSAKGPLGDALAAGVESLSRVQQITFTRYVRLVLPLDGYVFWVKADLVSRGALLNAARYNAAAMNAAPMVTTPATTLDVKGSVHIVQDIIQDEGENITINRMIFTSESEVNDLNGVGPEFIYIAEFDGQQYAFGQRGSFYFQADLYHYVGNAVYPDVAPQVISSLDGFDATSVVVSNSLPLWLALNGYAAPYSGGFGNPILRLFPSFLAPLNEAPPFASVHVVPEDTRAIQSVPYIDEKGSHWQLVHDRVRITVWGTRNYEIMDFVDCVNQYTVDTNDFGIMNMPVPRDEKREQRELGVIAQKKSIEYEISYYQSRVRDIARQLILAAIPTFIIQ